MQSSADIRALDHGFFQFPRPTTRHVVGYVIASGLFLVAFGLYTSSLSIPDVPRVEEAELLSSLHDDPGEYDYGELQKGYKQGDYAQTAAFVVIPLELEQGLLGQDECKWVEDDEGNGDWQYSFWMADARTLGMSDVEGQRISVGFALDGSLNPEGEVIEPDCSSSWTRDVMGYGEGSEQNHLFNAFMLVENEPVRYQLLSVVEVNGFASDTMPQEVTQREDRGRWALLASGIAGLIFMFSTTPSLKYDIARLRKQNKTNSKDINSDAGVLGYEGRKFQHLGPNFEVLGPAKHPVRMASVDWLFGAPPLPSSYENPYAPEGDGALIAEHPSKIGTPKPATVTLYSIGAVVFSTSFIWLSADLRARDGSEFHTMLGWGMTAFVTMVNFVWFYNAWKQFKLVRLINDLPTSPIRSAAVGQVEIVGQVRPSIAGTPTMSVGGRNHEGLVQWSWSSYKYECHTDSDGDTHCSWNHQETKTGGVPFMVHDGSGGMLIDPELWQKAKKNIDLGPVLDSWQRGDWKWDVSGFGVGDPVYILGDCTPRTEDHKQTWGTDPVLPNALVTVVPTTATGDASVLHYGTELDIMANNRSIFEILIVPMLVFVFGVFMFLNYTP